MSTKKISRKLFLKNSAATVALAPFLHNLRLEANTPPLRLLVIHSPLGTIGEDWVPKTTGANYALSPILTPLQAFKDAMLVCSGINLAPKYAGNPGNHKEVGVLLTGRGCEGRDESSRHSNISLDQYLATQSGFNTKVKALNVSDIKSQNRPDRDLLSAQGANQPIIPISTPEDAFKRVFGSVLRVSEIVSQRSFSEMTATRRSMFDALTADIRLMSKNLSGVERQKLEKHLDGIRALEKELFSEMPDGGGDGGGNGGSGGDGGGGDGGGGGNGGGGEIPPISCGNPPAISKSNDIGVNMRSYFDIAVHAMACDLTRIFTYTTIRPGKISSEVGLSTTNFHDDCTHGTGRFADHTKYSTWWAKQIQYLLSRMAAVNDAQGSLLDNSLVLWISEQGCRYKSGPTEHSHKDLPIVIAGKAGGALKAGQHIHFSNANHAQLLITIKNALGSSGNTMGAVSATALTELLR